MSLTVLDAGLHSLLVDAGRPGCRAVGLPVGGPADRSAWMLGNALVGNPPDALALEVTLAGPTLRAECDIGGAVVGAAFSPTINGTPVTPGATFRLRAGDVLKVGGTPTGVRGYLCVCGGFDGPTVLGSQSGLSAVRRGDVLTCAASDLRPGRRLPDDLFAVPEVIRCVPGPQRDWFTDDAFFTTPWTVAAAADRMGVRLAGPPLARVPGELVSEPVAAGAVQVTNDGRPVVLGVDGQTIGGYPKVAHVIRADLDLIGRLRPGATVRFAAVSSADAESAARERAAWLAGWLRQLRVAFE